MLSLRKELHNHPGVSGDEHYAHDCIVEHLQSLSPDALYTHVGGYGVVAYFGCSDIRTIGQSDNQIFRYSDNRIFGQSDIRTIRKSENPSHPTVTSPVIALRADIDALPIGHRCGHDGHTATLLRVAELLANGQADIQTNGQADNPSHPTIRPIRKTFPHGVLLIFQPEEETGLGAQKIIDSGVLRQYDIRCVLAVHNIPGYPLNEVLLSDATFAAASSGVEYHLQGRPTHASTPELGINPGLAVAEIIQQMQQFNSKSHSLQNNSQFSTLIAVRLGQRAFGTSAGDADIMFTLRAFTNDTMQRLLDEAHRMVADVAQRHGLTETHELVEPFRATENTPGVVAQLQAIAEAQHRHITRLSQPFRWSEDFSNYLVHYPGALLGIGAGEKHLELHHPDYDFPDEIIEPTAQLLYRFANDVQLV